jgi:hypothetical protein
MNIIITMHIADDFADPDHVTGVTDSAFEALLDLLSGFGDDIDIRREGS